MWSWLLCDRTPSSRVLSRMGKEEASILLRGDDLRVGCEVGMTVESVVSSIGTGLAAALELLAPLDILM